MAKEYKQMSIYITDEDYDVLDLPFLPEELNIKFDGNNAVQYLANGQFYTQKKLPKPKEIEISCFFPGKSSRVQVNKGLNLTSSRMLPLDWVEYFFDCMQENRTINLCFTWWNFEMDCTIQSFTPRITYAEVDDIYYTVKFIEYDEPYVTPLTTIHAQGHNSWITAGEWRLVGGLENNTTDNTATVDLTQYLPNVPTANTTAIVNGVPISTGGTPTNVGNTMKDTISKATEPTTSQSLIDVAPYTSPIDYFSQKAGLITPALKVADNIATYVSSKAIKPNPEVSNIDVAVSQYLTSNSAKKSTNSASDNINKNIVCKDSSIQVTLTAATARDINKLSFNSEDIANPKYDILNDAKYGSDPFFTRGMKSGNEMNNVIKAIENKEPMTVLKKVNNNTLQVYDNYSKSIFYVDKGYTKAITK